MVAVFNKELLSWYLITVKLKETIDAGIQHAQSPTGTRSIEYPEEHLQKQQQQQLQQQHQPLDPLRVVINDGDQADNLETSGPKSPKSKWVITIKDKLEQARLEAGAWAKLCIYRVPQCLRESDDKAYIPQTVSLGPYHHGRRRLRSMDHHKWRALHHVLKRLHHDIRLYLDSIKEVEEKARDCYEGKITLGSNEFVEMMVLDGCFVLELFRGATEGFKQLSYNRNDPVFAMRGSMHSIQWDMIMLENQLPLFVLDRLLGLQYGQPEQRGMVVKLAVRFFEPLMPTDEPLSKSDMKKLEWSLGHATTFVAFSDQGGLHCLDIFRRSLLQTGPKPEPRIWIKRWSHARRVADKRRQQLIHCVTELNNSGIKFKKRKTEFYESLGF